MENMFVYHLYIIFMINLLYKRMYKKRTLLVYKKDIKSLYLKYQQLLLKIIHFMTY